MTLPELSIRRHVLAWMLSGVLLLFGIISFLRIGIDRFPYIEFPIISITTTQKGANPDVVDASITSVIETAVNSTPGIQHINSTSSPGVSIVAITFDLDKDIDVAFNEVQAKVNQVLKSLPQDADPPVVAKVATNASPIFWVALQGDRTQQQLNQYARNVVKKRLETVAGVGEVRLGGRRDRTIRVNLDPQRMAALGVTAQDLVNAFNREHIQQPGGFVTGQSSEYLLKLDLEFHTTDALEEMVVAYRNGAPIKLKQVAEVEDGLSDYRQLARFNGKPTVGIGIVKVANTNTVEIIKNIKTKLDQEIIPQLPPGMTLTIASDDSLFIQQMVDSLMNHLVEGTVLAALIVLLFLKSWRSTLIISLAIPVSLLGAIAVIYFFGYTFNSLTLLALLLLIGVVVDDAIVVLENIYRHREMAIDVSAQANPGEAGVKPADAGGRSQNIYRHREAIDPDPVSAALAGSREVVFAVLAATLSLVSIFAPVIFMGGIIGMFFQSFAVVVTFGVLVSLFVSLTLTPMLCARYLTVQKRHGRLYQALDAAFQRMDEAYRRLLGYAMGHRWKIVIATVLVVLSSGWFFVNTGKTFVPEEDEGRFLVFVKTPLGSSIDYTSGRLAEVEKVLARHPEINTYFAAIGLGQAGQVNEAFASVRMVPPDRRTLKQYELIPRLKQELAQIPGARVFPAPIPIVGGQRGEALQFVVSGPNLQEVGRLAKLMQDKLSADPGIGRLDMNLQLDLPQIRMNLDRTRANSLGLSANDVALAVNLLTGGIDVARFNDEPGDGERYYVRLKAQDGEFTRPTDLANIYLRAANGELVRIDTIAQFEETLGPAVIGRMDLQYAAQFFGSPTIPLGEAVSRIQEAATGLLPPGYTVKMVGQAEEFQKTAQNMAFAFVLALVLLYMVLASQFNSFLQPLIIMVAQPLAIIGGVVALWLTGHTINIYSMIGLVLLIGLVAKNSILLVDLANQRRSEGMTIDAALLEACPIRLRPVLMTSFTVILALLPAALGLGAGAETNGPLAVAVIGGMLSSTLLTLVVVPAVYSLVENWVARRRKA
ncbi:HAE1 family hydrophobic/amphiphilic exporter-1 [Sulfuritortus calidifontis]|uniref:HAE1 family hydrophobic/amphiphilic exporter-1 n=1 Tax=Sulfuritortus calidifontis TaxID=1914471 RepID=A0A4R3JYK8_9PROT|nr:efflux RND transporter permease subunit [Sulfuritortus calidifontis]TCS72363.1 HAE1 family hydrophobic/amphiphilic exporter-1 [Sulfuritortus calidifontis]